jgi:radical SAM superfamily enzyme YgiQ (UPF0313 family)
MPEETLTLIPSCDFVVRGEGEFILHDLVRALDEDRPLDSVQGISYREDGEPPRHSPDGAYPGDVDDLPFLDREEVADRYRDRTYSSLMYGSPCDSLMTSRGCPHQCRFCFKVCDRYRGRSADSVLEEFDHVVRLIAPAGIQFMDDSFTIQKERAHAILDGLIRRGNRVRIKVRSRVNAVDEELLRKMKRAGVDTIVYGLESGSQKMLDAFQKRTTVEQNIQACRLARKVGLHCLGDMLLFYPGETRETLRETESFVRKARPTAVKFNVLSPLPETEVYRQAEAEGTLVGRWELSGDTPWVRLDTFEGLEEMQAIAKRMYVKSLLSPVRALRILGAYGPSMLRNPTLTARSVWSSLGKKLKY